MLIKHVRLPFSSLILKIFFMPSNTPLSLSLVFMLCIMLNNSLPAYANPNLDEYGGYADIPVPGAKLGNWGTAKLGNRWVMVTPAGNAFINLGVFNLGQGSGRDEDNKFYTNYWHDKYTQNAELFCTAQLKRLRSWGFNAIADYSYEHCKGFAAIGSKLPHRTASFTFPINGADYSRRNVQNLLNDHVKELIRPCNKSYAFWPAKVADYYDPKFAEYIEKRLVAHYPKNITNLYTIGISTDESDNLYGFGAGDDFVELRVNEHLGLIVAVAPPTQTTEPDGQWTYKDTTTYSKLALKNFLKQRYGTIEKLNAAWGSSYSTFESDGGWEKGSGFLDEDGRSLHKTWLGKDPRLSDGTADPDVKKDLDDFLYEIAKHYFKTYHDIIKKHFPDVLQVGPMTVGSWGVPPRRQVLMAASEYLDIFRSGLKEPNLKEKIDFTIEHLGKELPMIAWVGATANADSGLHNYQIKRPINIATQEARGDYYEKMLNDLITTQSSNGSYLFVGIQFWEWVDNWNEKTNWGLVTIRDNAYDGVEAVTARSHGASGYKIGGESKNYGDFISKAKAANNNVSNLIFPTLKVLPTPKILIMNSASPN